MDFETLEQRLVPAPMTGLQLLQEYHVPANQGAGETVGIVIAGSLPNLASDTAAFNRMNHLAPTNVIQVMDSAAHRGVSKPVDNIPVKPADGSWEVEGTLDVDMVHLVAPKAKIIVEEAAQPTAALLMFAASNVAAKANIVSMSWGTNDGPYGGDFFFDFPEVTYFAASGDSGVTSWPSTLPEIAAVGGTNWSGHGESMWVGSGAGSSAFNRHKIPDIVANGGDQSPVQIVWNGRSGAVYGTSESCPLWAGFAADLESVGHFHFTTHETLAWLRHHSNHLNHVHNGGMGSPNMLKLLGDAHGHR